MKINRYYILNLHSRTSEYLQQKFTNTKISFQFNVSLWAIDTHIIGISGRLGEIQNPVILENMASMLKIPLTKNLLSFIPRFTPLSFSLENNNEHTNIKITGKDIDLSILHKLQKVNISAVLYKSNTLNCTITITNNKFGKCAITIDNFAYGNVIISRFSSEIFLKLGENNINFTISNPTINIRTKNINIKSIHKNCRIKGILHTDILSLKANLQKKCKFSVEKVHISPLTLHIQHTNQRYIVFLSIKDLLVRNDNYIYKFQNTTLLYSDIYITTKNIESNFKLNTKIYNSVSLYPILKKLVSQSNRISVEGKVTFNIENGSAEFSNLGGQIDNIKINDGVVIINNNWQVSFVNLEIDHQIQLDKYLENKTIVGIEDFYCDWAIKTFRITSENLEISGEFSKCKLFLNDFIQVYNTGGFWRFSTDKEFKNIELIITTNNGIIAIPTKKYNLSKDHIIVFYIPIKRVVNIIETHPNISFIPQNEYINIDLYTFIQKIGEEALLTSEGTIKSNIRSNSFISKLSSQTVFNTRTLSFHIQQLKGVFSFTMKNIAQLKNSFEEIFDYVNLQGYFWTRGILEIKNNKINKIESYLSFILPKLTLDNIQLSKIRGKIPININKDKSDKVKKGNIKFSIEKPIKINFSATIEKIIPPCIFIEEINIKYTYFHALVSKFNFCIDPSKQIVNIFNIPIKKITINIASLPHLAKILSEIKSDNGHCEVIPNHARFNCLLSLNITSDYFPSTQAKILISGKYTTTANIFSEITAAFTNIKLEGILKNFGFQKSLTGQYNLYITLKMINSEINEIEGYIENADTNTKKISTNFFNDVTKKLFNIKTRDIKTEKNFNQLGLYFRYIKGKLIIKSLYYIKKGKVKKYTKEELKNRQILLKSSGEQDCIIYGSGANAIRICTKGVIIISMDKLLKIKNKLAPYLK